MATAYAALLSVKHILNQLEQHPRPPISLHQQYLHSLTENLDFLQDFLERSCSDEAEELEMRVAGVAHAAEDAIESHIVDQIHARSTCHAQNLSCVDFYQDLERVIQDMDSIKKEVVGAHLHQLRINPSISTAPLRSVSRMQNNTMVDFGDILIEILDKLTGQPDRLQTIPIVGMGGIGKTTLARNIYGNPLIVHHFEILAWVTISQEYSRRGVLHNLCGQIVGSINDLSEDELGERVYKNLWGRRYLIVMDDIWSVDAWDKVKSFFPNNYNGSRIMITTRLSNLALELSGSHDFQMKFLDDDKSWDLLCEIVFGKDGCPTELEDIGKKIARNCRGLPLSIVVIGGVLTKSDMTREYWENTLENLDSIINLENNEHCLQILRMSYKALPIHLKPCFLYMRVFPEYNNILVLPLIHLWVVEGFLKPINDKSLEEAAEEYLKELIDRNLIIVNELRWNGKTKSFKIHDLLRDLCLREAQKQRFICVLRSKDPNNITQDLNVERSICIEDKYSPQFHHALQSASLTRSLFLMIRNSYDQPPLLSCRLLRVYLSLEEDEQSFTADPIFQMANLRCILMACDFKYTISPSSFSIFWNLQILLLFASLKYIFVPSEIWELALLRHVMVQQLELPDPPRREDNIVLVNLQTLFYLSNCKFSEEMVKRIPNVKKLKLEYNENILLEEEGSTNSCLKNLGHLQKLESLRLNIASEVPDLLVHNLVQYLNFPHSLKKLTLIRTKISWEELTTKIGSLPLLEELRLKESSCIGPEWETVKGKFCSLKFLLIRNCNDLEKWKMDETHFPHLEHLVLEFLFDLKEIPSSVGDIPTLQSIKLSYCSKSAKESAERIEEEQEDNGNVDLKIYIGVCFSN